MRHLILGALLLAGCQDYNELQKDFCATARIKHFAPDGGSNTGPVAFCDGFEGQFSSTLEKDDENGGTNQIETYTHYHQGVSPGQADPEYAYRGTGVFHATAPSGGAAQVLYSPANVTLSTPAVRFFLWDGNGTGSGSAEIIALLDSAGKVIRSVSLSNGVPTIYDAASNTTQVGPDQLQPQHWSCVQIVTMSDRFDLIVDAGSPGAFFFTVGPLPAQAQTLSVRVGPRRGTGDPGALPTELWIDELIIDNDYIGCNE